MTLRFAFFIAVLGTTMTLSAQEKPGTRPMTAEEFMAKVNTYLREQDAAVTEEVKSVRDGLQKTSADVDLHSKTLAGIQEKLKELQQELAKVQLENVRLKKELAKNATKQANLVAAEKKARAEGDLKLAAQLAAVIKKTNTIIRETVIDKPEPAPGKTETYVVQAGDTLGAIAMAYGTSVAKIKAANGLKGTTIRVGQKLTIPGTDQ